MSVRSTQGGSVGLRVLATFHSAFDGERARGSQAEAQSGPSAESRAWIPREHNVNRLLYMLIDSYTHNITLSDAAIRVVEGRFRA